MRSTAILSSSFFDEPNSNLDMDGETALAGAISSVRLRGGIVIVVAHRPSTLASVDLVLAMREGQAVAFGPKDLVLAKVTRTDNFTEQPKQASLKVVGERSGAEPMTMQSQRSLNRHILSVWALSVALVGGMGGWAASTALSNAVVGQGTVIIDQNVKKVQHLTGGIVSELVAREGAARPGRRCSPASRQRIR